MAVFPFGEFLPDVAPTGNPGITYIRGLLPQPRGYGPFRKFSAATGELPGQPLGAIAAIDEAGAPFQYAGDAGDLYENVDGTWTIRSKGSPPDAYSTGTGEYWEFAVWKNKVLATNFSDPPQQITFGQTAFSDLTTALRARRIAIIRDFVVLANTFDATDGDVPSRVRWSAFNNETDFTVSPSTLSGFQDLKISKIQRLFGGQYGVILQPDRVWRMSFVGAPVVFQFDEVLPGIGLIAPRAAACAGDIIYVWSNKGMIALEQGARATPIGAGKVDAFLKADLDQNFADRVTCVADPASQRVAFAYPGADATDGNPNRIAIYDRTTNRWSLLDEDTEMLWAGAGATISLDAAATSGDPDELDDEDGGVSFDDPRWIGGTPGLAAFGPTYLSGFFDGDTREARIETPEYAFGDGARSRLTGLRGLIEGGAVKLQVGTRNSLADQVTWGPEISARRDDRFTFRSNARYHRFRFLLSGDWRHATGMEIGQKDIRRAERRG